MTIYAIEFVHSAEKEISKLPSHIRLRILKAISSLSLDPRKGNVRPMVGTRSWRLRVGDYRVIYDISEAKVVIVIIRIGHRKQIYRK